jgi:hypothetical protein
MTRQEKIDKASTEWDKAYAIFHKADFEYTEIVAKATDDPEPQADDVETIRATGCESCAHKNLTHCPYWIGYKASCTCLQWIEYESEPAPVDVQAKAEAVAKAFIETHARMLTEYETCELVRLIVEQFTRKG